MPIFWLFFSHHQAWGYTTIDTNGEFLMDFTTNNGYNLIFDEKERGYLSFSLM